MSLLVPAANLLQQARERVAHGVPSLALAIAGPPYSSALARIQEAEAVRYDADGAAPWAPALNEALAILEEARELWGKEPDVLPPLSRELPPCGVELRLFLPSARACAENRLAWEDPGGLTRPQALCVAHLAVCLAHWRAREEQLDTAARETRARLNRESDERAAVAARAIWGPVAKRPNDPPTKVPASLRELASVSSAFADWGDEMASDDDL